MIRNGIQNAISRKGVAVVAIPADLETAITHLLSATGPALLSVVTDENAAFFTFSKEMMEGSSPENHVSNFLPLVV